MKKAIATLIMICSASAASAWAEDKIVLAESFAVVGEPILVQLESETLADTLLQVTYRPNSETEKEEMAGSFDESGRLMWTPLKPGLASLCVKNKRGEQIASLEIGVCFSEIPKSGIGVMLFAGWLLFGGAAFSLVIALRKIS